ncbi:FAD-dependent oxidoreductase [Desulfocicer niacini]
MTVQCKYHVIIVGCGLAGMSAADTLAGQGLDILIIDENVHAGGQLIRKVPKKASWFPRMEPDGMKKKGFSLAQRVKRLSRETNIPSGQGMERLIQAQVLGIFSENRLLIQTFSPDKGETMVNVQADHLILATGARERYLPFKGWDLPGVISLGGAQILMKSHGVLPARETLIAGTSPLQMVLATELLANGGQVSGLLDENTLKKKLAFLPHIKNHWPKLLEGGFHMGKMALTRTPMEQGVRIVEACGGERLESVVVAKTNFKGDVIRGTETTWPTRSLAMGYGFVPNIELPVQAGCNASYDKDKGGWVIQVDDHLETSVPSVYAAGEITGIAGAKKSHVEGKLVALSILDKLGKMDQARVTHGKDGLQREYRRLITQRRRQMDYGSFLNDLCRVPSSAYAAIPDETIICRCEEITMGQIKKSLGQGFNTTGGLKKATRCGMGRCQGRICGPVILDIITALTRKKPESIGASHTRAPVKNVGVSAFLNS